MWGEQNTLGADAPGFPKQPYFDDGNYGHGLSIVGILLQTLPTNGKIAPIMGDSEWIH